MSRPDRWSAEGRGSVNRVAQAMPPDRRSAEGEGVNRAVQAMSPDRRSAEGEGVNRAVPQGGRLRPVIAGAAAIMLVAGAAAAHTQASPEVPGLIGTIAALFGCTEAFDAAMLARDALDEAEFQAVLEAAGGPGP